MIKLEHFNYEEFDIHKFLTDLNPNKDIFFSRPRLFKIEAKDIIINYLKKTYGSLESGYYIVGQSFGIRWFGLRPDNELDITQFFYTKDFNYEEFEKFTEPYKVKPEFLDHPCIKLVSIRNGQPVLVTKYLKSPIILDFNLHYNTDFELDKVDSLIKSDKSGLLLFTGLPGTGKTTLLKYFSQKYQSYDFVFINNNNFSILTDPSFTDFCLEKLNNSVIILEDCEKLLLSRDHGGGFDISSILNLTDGLLGDLLNVKVIATLNTVDKIDTALLRKGRLLAKVNFNKLSVEQAQRVIDRIGNNSINITEPTVLADLYNIEDNGNKEQKTNKIGF